ncbi:MAG: glycosyl hydrolase [Bacteroidales bacterium]
MKRLLLPALILSALVFYSCSGRKSVADPESAANPFELTSKPYARYWWFASTIRQEDIRYNLDWLKANGFGGVEIAWVYPLNRFNPRDTSYTPRQEWLSEEWSRITGYAVRYADSIGLGCDLTLGTLWPFGDSYVPFNQATRRYGDQEWRQVITRSWEHPKPGYVIDHLTPSNYLPYFNRLLDAFPRPETRLPQSYFIDSWEVETEYLWSEGFDADFKSRFGYDITHYMDSIYKPSNQRYLYDYMSLVSEKVLGFYRDFDSRLNEAGVLSRGQVSGAPCDLISGYSLMDIPEGESMLFEPEFCAIPASSALLSSRKAVSSETFTCLYGWPADYLRREQTADLKLVADALFANGINHIVWHGKPHNPSGYDTVSFYASTHAGADAHFADELPEFNRYLEKVSSYMKKGDTYADIAVYLPTEDAWRAGIMPSEKQFIWAWGYYEMRYVYFPEELKAYNPAWINYEFLEKGEMSAGTFNVGNARFKALYIDSKFLEHKVVRRIAELAGEGLPVVMKQIPEEPGTIIHEDYMELIGKIRTSRQEIASLPAGLFPFIKGPEIPVHWCRKDENTLYVFFPNPQSERLKFPLEYGQSLNTTEYNRPVELFFNGRKYSLNLEFRPYQSLLYRLKGRNAEKIDIEFVPPEPVKEPRPDGYIAPWLVR